MVNFNEDEMRLTVDSCFGRSNSTTVLLVLVPWREDAQLVSQGRAAGDSGKALDCRAKIFSIAPRPIDSCVAIWLHLLYSLYGISYSCTQSFIRKKFGTIML